MKIKSRKSIVHGVGVNDSKSTVSFIINGKRSVCPVYDKWKSMLARCYSKRAIIKNPTYAGCSVCDEWLLFSKFKKWHDENYSKGMHIDKDIKVIGNKVYGPEFCLFVTRDVNNLLTKPRERESGLKTGVSYCNRDEVYIASVSSYGKLIRIGSFGNKRDARNAYVKRKNEEINRHMKENPDISKYLINHLLSLEEAGL